MVPPGLNYDHYYFNNNNNKGETAAVKTETFRLN